MLVDVIQVYRLLQTPLNVVGHWQSFKNSNGCVFVPLTAWSTLTWRCRWREQFPLGCLCVHYSESFPRQTAQYVFWGHERTRFWRNILTGVSFSFNGAKWKKRCALVLLKPVPQTWWYDYVIALALLQEKIAPGAFHNSEQRYNPPKCHLL